VTETHTHIQMVETHELVYSGIDKLIDSGRDTY
jgi:hypothetical protein